MEKNLSTFANEMESSAMILGLATSQSLILIDELGRGTSPREGIGISHAIAEALIRIKVSYVTRYTFAYSVTLNFRRSVSSSSQREHGVLVLECLSRVLRF